MANATGNDGNVTISVDAENGMPERGTPPSTLRMVGKLCALGGVLLSGVSKLTVHITEFTDPQVPRPKDKRLDKWLFTMHDHDWFCIAGIWRSDPKVGEAFTMLTIDAGDEIKPYHHRQIIPLKRDQWAAWLDPTVPALDVLQYLPKGSLPVTRIYPLPASMDQPMLSLDL